MNWKSVDTIRAFNRTYLAALNLYDQNYLNSGYTTTDARILHEIYERKSCSANELIRTVRIDKGYMSRILKRFQQAGIIERTVSAEDGRVHLITLTEHGLSVTLELIEKSRESILCSLHDLSDDELEKLSALLGQVTVMIRESTIKKDRKEGI